MSKVAGRKKRIIITTAAGGALSPGGPTQTFTFTVTNPGTGVKKLSTVTAAVAATDGTA